MGGLAKERRKFVRANFPCKIMIYDIEDHSLFTHTENIGAGGVRVIIEEKLDVFSSVGLEIYIRDNPVTCKGKVVWVVEKKSRAKAETYFFDTGIEFYDIKDRDRKTIDDIVRDIAKSNDDS